MLSKSNSLGAVFEIGTNGWNQWFLGSLVPQNRTKTNEFFPGTNEEPLVPWFRKFVSKIFENFMLIFILRTPSKFSLKQIVGKIGWFSNTALGASAYRSFENHI